MKLRQHVFKIICFVGLVVQLCDISARYFKFKTRGQVAMKIPLSVHMPAMSFCSSVYNFIDFYRAMNKTGVYFDPKVENLTVIYMLYDKLTLADIFDLTPDPDKIFSDKPACFYRVPGKYINDLPYGGPKECKKHFDITKYSFLFSMCYKITPNVDPHMYLQNIEYLLSSTFQGLIYQIRVNPRFTNNFISKYFLYPHEYDTSQLYDSMFASYTYNRNFFQSSLSYRKATIENLEPPYDTWCRQISSNKSNLESSLDIITERVLKMTDKITPITHMYHRVDKKLFSSQHMRQEKFFKIYDNIVKSTPSSPADCRISYLLSQIKVLEDKKSTELKIFWPVDYGIDIMNVAMYEITDYILYTLSALGIWFGISILSVFDFFSNMKSHTPNDHQACNLGFQTLINFVNQENARLREEIAKLDKKGI